MIDPQRIKAEADAFFEWPSKDKTHVTTTSMLMFSALIAEMACTETRESCARVCDEMSEAYGDNSAGRALGIAAAKMRSNAIAQGREHSERPAGAEG